MKLTKLMGLGFALGLLTLVSASSAEARSHFSFGFGVAPALIEQRYAAPCYVEEYYQPYQETVIRRGPYGQETWVTTRPALRPVLVPAYRERVVVQPRPMFSFGFWR